MEYHVTGVFEKKEINMRILKTIIKHHLLILSWLFGVATFVLYSVYFFSITSTHSLAHFHGLVAVTFAVPFGVATGYFARSETIRKEKEEEEEAARHEAEAAKRRARYEERLALEAEEKRLAKERDMAERAQQLQEFISTY